MFEFKFKKHFKNMRIRLENRWVKINQSNLRSLDFWSIGFFYIMATCATRMEFEVQSVSKWPN